MGPQATQQVASVLLLAMVAATVTLSVSTTAMFVKHTEAAAAEAARVSMLSALLAPPPMPEAHPATLLAALVGQLDPPTMAPGVPQAGPHPPPPFTLGNLMHQRHAPPPEPAAAPASPAGKVSGLRPEPTPTPSAAAPPADEGAAGNLQDLLAGAAEPPPAPTPAPPLPLPPMGFQSMGQMARDMSVAIGLWREKQNWLYQMGAEPARRRRLRERLPWPRRWLRGAPE